MLIIGVHVVKFHVSLICLFVDILVFMQLCACYRNSANRDFRHSLPGPINVTVENQMDRCAIKHVQFGVHFTPRNAMHGSAYRVSLSQ